MFNDGQSIFGSIQLLSKLLIIEIDLDIAQS